MSCVMSSCELVALQSSLYHYIILTITFLQSFYTQHFLLFAVVCVHPPHIFRLLINIESYLVNIYSWKVWVR